MGRKYNLLSPGAWKKGSGILIFGMAVIMSMLLFVFMFMELYTMRQDAMDEQYAADTIADGTAIYAMRGNTEYDDLTDKAEEISGVIGDTTGLSLDSVEIDEGSLDEDTVSVSVSKAFTRLSNALPGLDTEYTLSASSATQFSVASSANGDVGTPVDGGTGQDVVDYAVRFIGNPYAWGGTSLTNGCDCSGFVMSVYAHFGVSLPHSSYALRSVGYGVTVDEIQPGDIVCYSGHVGIYVGNSMIVNASNSAPYPEGGIKYSPAFTRTVLAVRRIF